MGGFKLNSWHYAAAILVIALFVFNPLLSFTRTPPFGSDYTDNHIMLYQAIRDSWLKDDNLYSFWNPIVFAGTPLFSKLISPGPFFPLNFLILVTPSAIAALNLTTLLSYALAGIAMFLLVRKLTESKNAAFIAGLFYMLNGFSLMFLYKGWTEYVRAFAIAPLVFLLVIYALRERSWLYYAVLAGLGVFFQLEAGGSNIALWEAVLVGLFFAYSVIGKKPLVRLAKAALVGVVLCAVFLGLGAVRLLPYQEHNFLSTRAQGVAEIEAMVYQRVEFNCVEGSYKCINDLVEAWPPSFTNEGFDFKIGIIGLALVGIALGLRWRNRFVIFFSLIIVLAILLALGTKLMYFFWKYVPGFASHRYPHRALFLYSFAASVLTGIGAKALFDRFPKKKLILFISIVALIIVDLVLLGGHQPKFITFSNIRDDFPVYKYIGEQPGIFRIHPIEIYSVNKGFIPLALNDHLEFIYGYDTLWEMDYLPVHLSAVNADRAKMMGMLNVKYITAKTSQNLSGFTFVNSFPLPIGAVDENNQTLLYRNERYLPRAYIVHHAALVVGAKDNALQTSYALLLDPAFQPQSAVIVTAADKTVQELGIDYLRRFDVIVLSQGSVDGGSMPVLQQYTGGGGLLVPDITKGEQQPTTDEIVGLWVRLHTNLTYADVVEVPHELYTPDKRRLAAQGPGFLVLSEKFAFSGMWRAEPNLDLMRADGILTAVSLPPGKTDITFVYDSKAFRKGATISIITAIVVLGILGLWFVRRKRKKAEKKDEAN